MNENKVNDIMNRIKTRRLELGISYQTLSDKTGISKSTWQRYETGSIKNMPINKVELVASVLQTTPAYLMGWENDIPEKIASGFLHIHDGGITKYNDLSSKNKEIIDIIIESLFNQQMLRGGE